uniref:Transposase n=1 Tax=Ascaris lumbricoides TaxID=6252 RepID=A0A0M3HJ44_ASCLU
MSKADTYFKDTGGTVGYTIDALQSCDGRSKRRRDSVKVEEANSIINDFTVFIWIAVMCTDEGNTNVLRTVSEG